MTEKEGLNWGMIFSSPFRERITMLTGTTNLIEGCKKLCNSNKATLALEAFELLLTGAGRFLVALIAHIDSLPGACWIFPAAELFDYEDEENTELYIVSFLFYSPRSNNQEFVCFMVDNKLAYYRLCTMKEMNAVWSKIMNEQ